MTTQNKFSHFTILDKRVESMEPITKQGFLNKQGEIVQNWKRRW